jgi:hypothetical protein
LFGYILPEKPELKLREYELFRAYYCGVCKSIGKRYGQLPRFTLNYDSTFLAILLSSLTQGAKVRKERCMAHPLKKRMVAYNEEIVDYASDMNILLAWYNLKDKWHDDRSYASLAIMTGLRRAFRKIKGKYKDKCDIIEKCLNNLSVLEEQKAGSADRASEPFAKLMEEVMMFEPLIKDKDTETVIRWIGFNLGKWIYILDAFDDLEKDIRKNAYNPLLLQYSYTGGDIGLFKTKVKPGVEFNLTYCLDQISKAFELLQVKSNAGILENIIYLGMLRKTEQILNTGSCNDIEKPV